MLLDLKKKLTKSVFKAPKWTKSFLWGRPMCPIWRGAGALYSPYLSDFGRPIWDPW